MNCTNSLLDEAYASYSGLDLTLKDQSVLESHVQASSTPRRVNYTHGKQRCVNEMTTTVQTNSTHLNTTQLLIVTIETHSK
ncbi:unnamed protein product [Heterobilharzia americana]|nr:unnamed protein product [Heterobilharzia americana]